MRNDHPDSGWDDVYRVHQEANESAAAIQSYLENDHPDGILSEILREIQIAHPDNDEGLEEITSHITGMYSPSEYEAVATIIPDLVKHYGAVLSDPYSRETITELALSQSLCPVHFVDYAICFDDQPYDCYQVRIIHPNHDT